jgi:hypothetical protein
VRLLPSIAVAAISGYMKPTKASETARKTFYPGHKHYVYRWAASRRF